MRKYQFRPPREPIAKSQTPARRSAGFILPIARLIPVVFAGSGLLNLLSLMGGAGSSRPGWLRDLFPLEFTEVHRSATLLLGYAQILTAIHLTGMKKRAFQLAVGLALASTLFHLTKASDPKQAVCSLALAGILLAMKPAFRVGSAKPDLALALERAALALAIAAAYGVLGFWLLEPHEFGRNFHLWQAVGRTLRVMLQFGDSGLSPRTPYAAWFLESLYLISAAAFPYCGVTLFRPVSYRFHPSDSDRELAHKIPECLVCIRGRELEADRSREVRRFLWHFRHFRQSNSHDAVVSGEPPKPAVHDSRSVSSWSNGRDPCL